MIKIEQKDFEDKVQQIIDGKTTRTKLIKELKIDRVTLNYKIQELVVFNPELYRKFITKFPYMPRKYTHINWRAMLIDIMKKGYTKIQAAEQYGINSRTIARKVYEVQKEDENIVNLYREVSGYRKRQKPLPPELQEKVNNLPNEDVFIGGIYDKREKELMELEKKYNDKLLKGEMAFKASADCGVQRASKNLNTLYRIKIENYTKKSDNNDKDNGEER